MMPVWGAAGVEWVLGRSILYFISLHCVTPVNGGTNYLFLLTEMDDYLYDSLEFFAQCSLSKLFRSCTLCIRSVEICCKSKLNQTTFKFLQDFMEVSFHRFKKEIK